MGVTRPKSKTDLPSLVFGKQNPGRGGLLMGKGDPIGVEYTAFEVVGASNWAWHEGGQSIYSFWCD